MGLDASVANDPQRTRTKAITEGRVLINASGGRMSASGPEADFTEMRRRGVRRRLGFQVAQA